MLTFCRVTGNVLVVDVHLQLAMALLPGVLCSQQHNSRFDNLPFQSRCGQQAAGPMYSVETFADS